MKYLRNLSKLTVGAMLLLFQIIIISGQANAISWEKLTPPDLPGARMFHSSVYDPATNRMIVYAGMKGPCCGTGVVYNDVWVLTNANGLDAEPQEWIQILASGPLSQRWGHSAVYDSNLNRMIIYGGDSNVGYCEGVLNDVWVLENANGLGGIPNWIQLFPTGIAPPTLRSHTAVYDPNSNRMVVFGGMTNSCSGYTTEVWICENANGTTGTPNWIHLTPTGNSPSLGEHTAVYDEANNRMIVLEHLNSASDQRLSVLENANGIGLANWVQPTQTGAPPSYIRMFSSTYDPTNNRILISGGPAAIGENINVWAIENANGIGGPSIWSLLEPVSDPVNGFPNGRDSHTSIFHGASGKMIIFGGRISGANNTTTNDAWVLTMSGGVPENQPPTAEAGPDQIVIDEVTFDGSQSYDSDGTIVLYSWELKHRANQYFDRIADGENPTVQYLEPGYYDVTLTVTDDDGLTAADTMLLAVSGECSTAGLYTQEEVDGMLAQAVADATVNLQGQIDTLTAQNTTLQGQVDALISQLAESEAKLAAVEQGLANLAQSLQSAFFDPQFSIPGGSPEEQMGNLVNAIENLNHGQQQALYKNLGGKIGKGKNK